VRRGAGAGGGVILLNASGCLDALTAPAVARSLDAYVTKTVTPLPRDGNTPVRITETRAGLLNSIGLANPGVERFRGRILPRLADLGVPIWVSAGGFRAADYALVCEALNDEEAVAVVELNVSCPNIEAAPESVFELVVAAREATSKPLYVKLSPAVPDVGALARAAAEAGADGLSLVNTLRGLALDSDTLRPRLGTATGGLSGPALHPVALAAVFDAYQATGLPIVGMGGVRSGRDALELVAVGARAIALGTILFADAQAPERVRAELADELATRVVAGIDDVFAAAHARDEGKGSSINRRSRVGALAGSH